MNWQKWGILTVSLLVMAGVGLGCDDKQAVMRPAVSKLMDQAALLEQQGDIAKAIGHLEAAEVLDPKSYEVEYNLGVLYTQTQGWQAAVTHLNKAFQLNPSQPDVLYTLAYANEYWGNALLSPADEKSAPDNAQVAKVYQQSIEAYTLFLKTAPKAHPRYLDAQNHMAGLQSKLKELLKPQS